MKKIIARIFFGVIAVVILYQITEEYFIVPVRDLGPDGFFVGLIGLAVTAILLLIMIPIIKWIIKHI